MTRPSTRAPARLSDRAEVGVGTLIVFIAMVLVAAVAAAVIIGTSGSLQQRAMATGQEATSEVSSNLMVTGVYGVRNTTADGIYRIAVALTLSAGSQNVDLNQTIVRYSDGDAVRMLRHAAATDGFELEWIRGDGTESVATSGDLVELSFTMGDSELPPRSDFTLQLLQSVGAPVSLEIRTPATYASDLHLVLR